jgi:hypothetical protein
VFNQTVSFTQTADAWAIGSHPYITEAAITAAFGYFVREFGPHAVIMHVDHRWISDSLPTSLNFEYRSSSAPRVLYIDRDTWLRVGKPEVIEHLRRIGTLGSKKMYIKENYLRIWDCGYSTWVWYGS